MIEHKQYFAAKASISFTKNNLNEELKEGLSKKSSDFNIQKESGNDPKSNVPSGSNLVDPNKVTSSVNVIEVQEVKDIKEKIKILNVVQITLVLMCFIYIYLKIV